MVELFLKIPPVKKFQNFETERRLQNLYKKEIFEPEIKPMIEKVQDELYQLENKQAKGAKLGTNIRQELEDEKCSKTFFKVLSPWDRGEISIKLGTKHVI